jgi:hypothetical protein
MVFGEYRGNGGSSRGGAGGAGGNAFGIVYKAQVPGLTNGTQVGVGPRVAEGC